jgi:uncharacterized repeat protein (TIGR02543 family)
MTGQTLNKFAVNPKVKSQGTKGFGGKNKAWQNKNSSRQLRKTFALFMGLMLSLALISPAVFAQDNPGHAPDCSYSPGTPCMHVHDEACGGLEDPTACTHTHDGACGYSEAVACNCAGLLGEDDAATSEEIPAGEEGATEGDGAGSGGEELAGVEGTDPADAGLAPAGGELFPLAADPVVTFMTWESPNKADDPATYTAVFDTQTVVSGASCPDPGAPTVPTGGITYVFSGWYLPGEETPFNFATPITADLTLFARFMPDWSAPVLAGDWYGMFAATYLTPAILVIELTADITYASSTNTVVIPAGKTIKITSGPGGPYTVSAANLTNVFVVESGATLHLSNIKITGGKTASGGGIDVRGGTLIVDSGAVITNNIVTGNGGGISTSGAAISTIVMYGGSISSNSAGSHGAGIYLYNANFTMYGGEISNNSTTLGNGGGVYAANQAIAMYGGSISGNSATQGGGVLFTGSSNFTLNGGSISGNTAETKGGGVCNYGSTMIRWGGEISNNPGPGGAGGGS